MSIKLPTPLIHKILSFAHLYWVDRMTTLKYNRRWILYYSIQDAKYKNYFDKLYDDSEESFEDSFEKYIKNKRLQQL